MSVQLIAFENQASHQNPSLGLRAASQTSCFNLLQVKFIQHQHAAAVPPEVNV